MNNDAVRSWGSIDCKVIDWIVGRGENERTYRSASSFERGELELDWTMSARLCTVFGSLARVVSSMEGIAWMR
jgi:hypothetical protein